MLRKGVAVLAVSLVLAGCSSQGPSNGQIYGTAGGAALGAGVGRAIGHYTLNATLVGAAAGAVIGFAAGTYMDPPAQEKQANATIKAAEDGNAVAWSTEKGNKGSVAATGEQFSDRAGRACRPLKQDVTMNGEQSAREVTACKAADGTWIVTEYQPDKAD
ncbi:MAG: hypothetical protein K2X44_09165 [Magnetospirillum sp.]|nr:hypothetical protein [Magnetospirillum sp.]